MDHGVKSSSTRLHRSAVSAKHLLTVAVEEYFHATALKSLVAERHWGRLESRVEANTQRALSLLDEFNIKATFFVLGWVAERVPRLIAEIVSSGHEVACKSYLPRTIDEMSPSEFREDVLRSRQAVEAASGVKVLGYRIARGSISLSNLWALDILSEEGFVYDSSVFPRFRSIVEQPWRRFPHTHQCAGQRKIAEYPLSSCGPDGFLIPAAGGNYLRQFPQGLMQHAIAHWDGKYMSPFNMYFHVWELDPRFPQIAGASLLTRIRQYRNLRKMPDLLRYYFERYSFGSIAGKMGTQQLPAETTTAEPQKLATVTSIHERQDFPSTLVAGGLRFDSGVREQATVVVPCFNEESVLPYLCATLQELKGELDHSYDLYFIFVDDDSSDQTWHRLIDLFGNDPSCQLVKHATNQGVAETIMTGIRAARTEIVCSIDCDCSYDPRQLKDMLPLLGDEVSLVTASPYHPLGVVHNVPEWRLFLSRTLSRFYRFVLHNKISTQTSCFRVYRRSKVTNVDMCYGDFRGIAELLARIDLQGGKIVEYPAVLEARLLGYSKMKTVSTIVGHIVLLNRFAWQRGIGWLLRRPAAKLTTEPAATSSNTPRAKIFEHRKTDRIPVSNSD
jgi:polysaccharide deacetylase family protein (PEP-CTERM system associated)